MTFIPDKEGRGVNKELAQFEATTAPTSIYSPGTDIETVIRQITVANTSSTTKDFIVYLDNNGTTYDDTTTLFYQIDVPKNSSLQLNVFIAMNDVAGNLAVSASANNAITFSVYGTEYDVS